MDLKDQLKNLFPEHTPEETPQKESKNEIWMQDDPIICKYEKRKGKPITILEGYTGADADFKKLAKELGVTVNQVSNLIRPLIERRMLIENEEEELLLNPNINILRKTIKENLQNGDFEFDYTLNFKITKDE